MARSRSLSRSPAAVAARKRRRQQAALGASPKFWDHGRCYRKHGKCATAKDCTKTVLQARLKKMHHSPRYQKDGKALTKAQVCAEVRKAYKAKKHVWAK